MSHSFRYPQLTASGYLNLASEIAGPNTCGLTIVATMQHETLGSHIHVKWLGPNVYIYIYIYVCRYDIHIYIYIYIYMTVCRHMPVIRISCESSHSEARCINLSPTRLISRLICYRPKDTYIMYIHGLLSAKVLLTVVNGSNKPMSVERQNDFTYDILYKANKHNAHNTLTSCCEIRLFRFAFLKSFRDYILLSPTSVDKLISPCYVNWYKMYPM